MQPQTDPGFLNLFRFRPLERLRNVEFLRTGASPYDVLPADEKSPHAAIRLADQKNNRIRYEITNYNRSDNYIGTGTWSTIS